MRRCFALAAIVWLLCHAAVPGLANQDALSTARELYVSADYDGALAILDRLAGSSVDTPIAIAEYRMFCLLALDRNEEARQVIARIVESDPFYRPSESQASPRMRTAFNGTRKALLPRIAQRMYAEAKADFDIHDPGARARFDRVIVLLNDPDLDDTQLKDLRAIAQGFHDLSAALNPVGVPDVPKVTEIPVVADTPSGSANLVSPEPVRLELATTMTGPADKLRVSSKGTSRVFTPKDPPPLGLQPPSVLSQPMPQWSPKGLSKRQSFAGAIEVTIDEQGKVANVALPRPMLPAFDKALVKAAWTWKYRPALLNGTPVSFVKVIEIEIDPER
jgi:hypothetical protein